MMWTKGKCMISTYIPVESHTASLYSPESMLQQNTAKQIPWPISSLEVHAKSSILPQLHRAWNPDTCQQRAWRQVENPAETRSCSPSIGESSPNLGINGPELQGLSKGREWTKDEQRTLIQKANLDMCLRRMHCLEICCSVFGNGGTCNSLHQYDEVRRHWEQ